MATDQQINANRDNAQYSTGPRTETGRSISARNALALGLFTRSDYVRPDEQAEYQDLCTRFVTEVNPEGILEETWVTVMVSATWRLRRCGLGEHQLSFALDIDPMGDENGIKLQNSVDRARSLSFNMLRRATAELRRLQTDRAITAKLAELEADAANGDQTETPLVSPKQVIVCIDQHEKFKRNQSTNPPSASNCKNGSKRVEPISIDSRSTKKNAIEDAGHHRPTGTEDRGQ